jgi:hypothetical protein
VLSIGKFSASLVLHENICQSFFPLGQTHRVRISSAEVGLDLFLADNDLLLLLLFLYGVNAILVMVIVSKTCIAEHLRRLLSSYSRLLSTTVRFKCISRCHRGHTIQKVTYMSSLGARLYEASVQPS